MLKFLSRRSRGVRRPKPPEGTVLVWSCDNPLCREVLDERWFYPARLPNGDRNQFQGHCRNCGGRGFLPREMSDKYEARYLKGQEFPILALVGNIAIELAIEADSLYGARRKIYVPFGY